MKRVLVLALAGFLAAGFVAVADPAGAQEYDRYERGTAAPPPPPSSPPPARYRAVPPPPRPTGFHAGPYLFGHAGFFEPNDYSDGLSGYGSGWDFDVGIGSRLTPFFAVDGTLGMYTTSSGGNTVDVWPFTVGFRAIMPNPTVEPYLGAGIGLYYAQVQTNVFVYPSSVPVDRIDSSEATIGGYFSMGVDAWLNPKTALNLEGKYHWAMPTLSSQRGFSYDVDVSGWTLNVGLMVGF